MKKINYTIGAVVLATASVLTLAPLSVNAMTKNEIIYSNMNYNGEFYKTIVNNHLTLDGEKEELEDETKLKNILNLNGKETYKLDGSKVTWQNLGKDIFYSGEIEKEQPIKTEVKYYLDGEETNPTDIAGKKGKVKIEFKFTNDLKNKVKVNGKYENLYTPFVVTMGTVIDNKVNSNITVTNGKAVDTGSRNMVVALASPGLYESLGIKELKDMDKITLEYETTNFSLSNVYIVATPKLIEEEDLKVFDEVDSVYNNVQKLQLNMDKLTEGAKSLDEGAAKLSNGAETLSKNIKIASESIKKIQNGSISLNKGIEDAIEKISKATSSLNSEETQKSIETLKYLKSQNTNAINTIVKKSGVSFEMLEAIYKQNNLKEYIGDNEQLKQVKEAYELITLLQGNNMAIDQTIKTSEETQKTLASLVQQLTSGLIKARDGSKELSDGLTKLNIGVSKIYDGSVELKEGTENLKDGTNTIKEGTAKLNKEGINKLSGYAKTIKGYSDKAEALVNLSKEYKGYASDNSDSTMFIYLIKSLKSNK